MSIDHALQSAARLQAGGDFAGAERVYREILARQPNHPQALHDFGVLAFHLGRVDVAAMLIERSNLARPNHPDTLISLAEVYRLLSRSDDAIAACRRAIAIAPGMAEAHHRLGVVAYHAGDADTAINAWRRSAELKPDAMTFANLTAVLVDTHQIPAAAQAAEAALRLNPDFPEALFNYGTAMRDLGRIDAAMDLYRRASTGWPGAARAASGRLHLMNHHPDADNAALLEAHRQWADQFLAAVDRLPPPTNDRSSDRRLRVGYVSPHFYAHSVFTFLEPLLAGHDKSRVEVFCYSDTRQADLATERAKSYTDHWRDTLPLDDASLAAQIRDDAIDVLIDMAGHLANNRLLAFARKPAPVQITYLGYQHTTGMAAMDYRITDAVADPPGTDAFYTEKLLRLPRSFFCYRPIDDAPDVTSPPHESAGHVTFGSFNHLVKLSRPCLAAWAKILDAVPASRLLLLVPREEKDFLAPLIDAGIAEDRIDLAARREPAEFLKLISRADIALDPFPFNGHTTTCDTLWMGVPVVTLAGRTFAGRMSASVLQNLDLPDLIAADEPDYVQKAVALANDFVRLESLRHDLRGRMQRSSIMNSREFAKDVEDAYRAAWRSWLAGSQE